MKHQIAFVGGQLLPIYIGIKEFKPEVIHFIATNESIASLGSLKAMLSSVKIQEYKTDPFDFNSIKTSLDSIISKLAPEDVVSINVTGGTKIMVLAAQAIIQEKKIDGFYINQDETYIDLKVYSKHELKVELTIKEYLDLSGHNILNSNSIVDFSKTDFKAADEIESFANSDKRYSLITNYFRKKYNTQKLPEIGKEILNNNVEVKWDKNSLQILANGKIILTTSSNHISKLFFNTAWWELIVASEISKWPKIKELLINCELPFKTDKTVTKNEIDILVNNGKKLFFIECKSGNVKQEDINKMKIIKQTYGGVISKSFLVSRFLPSSTIIEKCKELDIKVFSCYAFSNKLINPLTKIHTVLDKLNTKGSIY